MNGLGAAVRNSRIFQAVIVVIPVWIYSLIGLVWKAQCFGPTYDSLGATVREDLSLSFTKMCATDIQVMWDSRGLGAHIFPYIFGSYVEPQQLVGGTVEYPVFSGLYMWLTGLAATNGMQFLIITTITMAIASTFVALLLANLVGLWALIWSLAPALVFYTSYNWDILPALCTVLAVWLVMRPSAQKHWSRNVILAAVLLGVGGLLKLYPLMFALPLALFFAVTSVGSHNSQFQWKRFATVIGVAVGTFVLGNLPFALLGFDGWMASFVFQGHRAITIDTLTIWWVIASVGFGFGGIVGRWLSIATTLFTTLAAAGALAAIWLGWRRRTVGSLPWVQISAAMLVAYLALNKVHSLQYTIWLLPFLALVAVPLWSVLAYLAVDAAIFLTWFLTMIDEGQPGKIWWAAGGGLAVLIVLRTLLYALLFFQFIKSELRSAPKWAFADPVSAARPNSVAS